MKHINISPPAIWKLLVASLLLCMMSTQAHAGLMNFGTYIGTFPDNDSMASVSDNLGEPVSFLDRINTPDGAITDTSLTDGFLSIFNFVLNDDDEIIAGDWAYTGPGTVTHIVIKAGPMYALYAYTDGLNMGSFTTMDVDNNGLSHITAYTTMPIPVPPALWLLGSGLLGLLGLRRDS